jgi:chorismate-pyruvate lyase
MPDRSSVSDPLAAVPFVYPMDEFYIRAGLPLPQVERIDGHEVPEPFKSLLVHESDMTPTLEKFHRARIHLKTLKREQRGDFYYRQVVLQLDETNTPVEFGAIKIFLGLFPSKARQAVLEETVPLGRLLSEFEIPHNTTAKAFFRLTPDDLIASLLELKSRDSVYGRRATISDLQKRPLAEIVEVLPGRK